MSKTKSILLFLLLFVILLATARLFAPKITPLAEKTVSAPQIATPTPLVNGPNIVPTLYAEQPQFITIFLDDKEFSVEVARTITEIELGLSSRPSIGSDGMLFVIDPPRIANFWMRAMQFPLDIVWIKDGVVIGFVENAPAQTSDAPDVNLPSYSSKEIVDHVLELPAGSVKQLGITEGTNVLTNNVEKTTTQ